MLKIISFKICPFVQRVTALLDTKNIPYEIDYIQLNNKPSWFLEISPHGQVPVLITDSGLPLFESDAIVEYLEEAYPPLNPALSPEQRAINRAWSYLASKHYLTQCSAQRSSDEATLRSRSQALNTAFQTIEDKLGNTRFFNGDTISTVDIAWLPLLHRAAIIEQNSGYDFLSDYPKLKAWQRTLMATGIPQASVSQDFEQVFSNFYLSEDTCLGHRNQAVHNTPSTPCASKHCC